MGHGKLMAGGNECGMECSGSWQRPTSKQRARGKIFGGEQSMRVKRGSMLLESFAFEKHTAIHASFQLKAGKFLTPLTIEAFPVMSHHGSVAKNLRLALAIHGCIDFKGSTSGLLTTCA
jgi:hypothetical protein